SQLEPAGPSRQRVSVVWGTAGGGVSFGRRLSVTRMGVIEVLSGKINSDHTLIDSGYGMDDPDSDVFLDYHLDSHLDQIGIQIHYFPWEDGFYAFGGLAYNRNEGRGYWRDVPRALSDAPASIVDRATRSVAFQYRFSPLALQMGIGWQGLWSSSENENSKDQTERQGMIYALEFGLFVYGSATVQWSQWMLEGTNVSALNALQERLSDDLNQYQILPQLALRVAYGF
ncbi:MAG: hypothetical protein P8176_09420, partial [Gammaproteobacteria bacterium]